MLTRAEGHARIQDQNPLGGIPGLELGDLPLGDDGETGRDDLRLEMLAVGELPVLVRNRARLRLQIEPDDGTGRGKRLRRARGVGGILEEDLHRGEIVLHVTVRRQNEIPSIEHLEEGIHVPFVNRTGNECHYLASAFLASIFLTTVGR